MLNINDVRRAKMAAYVETAMAVRDLRSECVDCGDDWQAYNEVLAWLNIQSETLSELITAPGDHPES
jgi:hypothetical protein